ncbi:ferrochelatase hem15 [Mortierella sp. AD031]|nr:ferrochelatase hem15 [Mortierella sp. AD031]KAG0214223.1 ferrochelatase hem15 [Mortierella sp. NVP41]
MSIVNHIATGLGTTLEAVIKKLNHKSPYYLVWQTQVGPKPWLAADNKAILRLSEKGRQNQVFVPIAYTSDHIENLFELDMKYGEEAHEAGITGLKRAESLNADSVFI